MVIPLTVLLAAAAWLVLRSPETSSRYRHVELDGRYDIIGRYPVDEATCAAINCYRFSHDAEGRLVRIKYRASQRPAADPFFGAAEVRIEHSAGWETRRFLGPDGEPVAGTGGFEVVRLELDGEGRRRAAFFHDAGGGPRPNEDGVTQLSFAVDEQGRRTATAFHDAGGNRIAVDGGVLEIAIRYDEGDFPVELRFLDEEDRPKESGRTGCAMIRREHDGLDNLLEARCYGEDGRLKEHRALGIAKTRFTYDERGNNVEQRYYGVDGRLGDLRDLGAAIIRWTYDPAGNKTKEKLIPAPPR